ncbi:MAG: hypothetical protein QXO19_02310 [Candidatus Aenigmatarchaeota archaeon]
MPTDIITLVLVDILRISPSLISRYPLVQDKLLYLILIPHIILFLFLILFAKATVFRIIGGHRAIETVLMLTVYLYIIWSGWYGTFLIPIFVSSFQILLILGVLFFIISMFIKPSTIRGIAGVTQEAGKIIAKKTTGKQKDIEILEKEIEKVNKQIKTLEGDPKLERNPYLQLELQRLKQTKIELESKLRELEG